MAIAQYAHIVIEAHGLYVQWAKDRGLVDQMGVRCVAIDGGDDHAHVAELDVDGAQVGAVIWRSLNLNF